MNEVNSQFEFRVGGNIDIDWTTLELIKEENWFQIRKQRTSKNQIQIRGGHHLIK